MAILFITVKYLELINNKLLFCDPWLFSCDKKSLRLINSTYRYIFSTFLQIMLLKALKIILSFKNTSALEAVR